MRADAVREAVAAGSFYPLDPGPLRAMLDDCLGTAARPVADRPEPVTSPKALIVPHAGYSYSGRVAAAGYGTVAARRDAIHRVVLLGPSHFVPVRGLAVSTARSFATPLGDVPVDDEGRRVALSLPQCVANDDAHAGEHSLEVQLPFLQSVLRTFALVPLAVGHARPDEVADVLDAMWDGPETLVVVSTDLSHYEPQASAVRHDRRTAEAIVAGRSDLVRDDDACGAAPLRGLLVAAARHGLHIRLLTLATSGDADGVRSRVVGYGAFAVG